jgi:hypothetical protein
MRQLNFATMYRAGFLASIALLTLFAWAFVGGRAGAMLWIGGFLALWAATRFVNERFAGFLLGDQSLPEEHDDAPPSDSDWDPSEQAPLDERLEAESVRE